MTKIPSIRVSSLVVGVSVRFHVGLVKLMLPDPMRVLIIADDYIV